MNQNQHPIPSPRDDRSIDLMFGDCTNSIQFAKAQMWDVVKWGIALQFTLTTLSVVVSGSKVWPLAALPLAIGGLVGTLIWQHNKWFGRNRKILNDILKEMGVIAHKLYNVSEAEIREKEQFKWIYGILILSSSLISACLIIVIMYFGTKTLG